ncbi:MAG: ROK family transcriptional regulator [Lentisphaerota bacterium]
MQTLISGKPQLNRKINASIVLNLLRREGPLSRADLAKMTGIRSTSISAIVEQLLKENLVHEIGRGKSTGGRHPIMLEINPGGLYAVGIEVGEDALNGVLVDLSGRMLAAESLGLSDLQVESVMKTGNTLLDILTKSSGMSRDKLSAVGVAVPGIISKAEGCVIFSKPLNWKMVPLQKLLSEAWKLDVNIMNNAMAGSMAEYFSGQGRSGVHSLLYVLVNFRHARQFQITSLGCGIVMDGRAYVGEGQIAGEIRVEIEHPIAAATKIMGAHAPTDVATLIKVSRERSEEMGPIWKAFAEELGLVIARGMDFLSPGRVVIGTDTSELEEFIGPAVREVIRQKAVAGMVTSMEDLVTAAMAKIIFSPLTRDTIARGAIVPELQELSLSPLLRESVLS